MDPMTDAALEREIERALAVDPSPEFVARVRTRIGEEPSPASRRFGWLFAGMATVAVAAAVVLAVWVVSPVGQPDNASLLASRSIGPAIVVPSVGPAKAGHYVPNGIARDDGRQYDDRRQYVVSGFSRTRASRTSMTPAPEPLFDTRETMALQRLIAGVREGTLDLYPVQNASTPTVMDLPPVVEIAIPPITITPLGESGQGERQ